MSETLNAIFLGLVQGLTEFLPVSSSGHLVLAQQILGIKPGIGVVFEVAVHIASLLAIVLFYRLRIRRLAVGALRKERDSLVYIGKLALGTLPAVLLVLVAREWLEGQFESLAVVGVCLLITGCMVWSTRWSLSQNGLGEPGWGAALLIGLVQAFAILPGISRSGSTVAAGLALGLSPLAAAEFSFLLGTIAIGGAGLLLLPELASVSGSSLDTILWAGTAALASGLLALWSFVWLLRSERFYYFAWYAWIVGGITLFWIA
jgi:undecaprenyl-diphosphatase